jgi:hypothetical protein
MPSDTLSVTFLFAPLNVVILDVIMLSVVAPSNLTFLATAMPLKIKIENATWKHETKLWLKEVSRNFKLGTK